MVDGGRVEDTEDYFGGFNVIVFTPEHLGLIKSEPMFRRQFMDRALFCLDRSHLGLVRRYNRILRERNACLRRYSESPSKAEKMLDAIDPQLSEVGASIVIRRKRLVEELQGHFREIHSRISGGKKEVSISYKPRGLAFLSTGEEWQVRSDKTSVFEETKLAAQKEKSDVSLDGCGALESQKRFLEEALSIRRMDDLKRGHTGVGPHHDDLVVRLEGRSARLTASQGEVRTLVIALKLSEVELVRETRSEVPVLLLDDLGSELDENRRSELFDLVLGNGGQTFLTTVVPQAVPSDENHQYLMIDSGKLGRMTKGSFPLPSDR